MPKTLSPYQQRAQKLQRLETARKFKENDRYEAMLRLATRDKDYVASLSPQTRLSLARYEEHKKLAAEVEREQEDAG
jgi:hypothetical protein